MGNASYSRSHALRGNAVWTLRVLKKTIATTIPAMDGLRNKGNPLIVEQINKWGFDSSLIFAHVFSLICGRRAAGKHSVAPRWNEGVEVCAVRLYTPMPCQSYFVLWDGLTWIVNKNMPDLARLISWNLEDPLILAPVETHGVRLQCS